MRSIRRILVAVKDPSLKSLPAVTKAAQLARALGAELELFHRISTPLYVDAYSLSEPLLDIERTIRRKCLEELEVVATSVRRKGLKVAVSAEWDYPIYEAVVRRAGRVKPAHFVARVQRRRRDVPLAALVATPGMWRIDTQTRMHAVSVGQVCTQRAVIICANAPLTEAKQLMHERCVNAVVVVASPVNRPTALGIITHWDIAHAEPAGAADISQLRISDILSRDPLVFNQDETIESAIRHLRARNTQHALVVGSGGAFFGLISLDDLLSRIAA